MPKKLPVCLILLLTLNFAFGQDTINTETDSTETGRLSGVPKTTKLENVTISSFHVNDSLLNAPAAVSVLSAKDIERNNNADISPVLNTLPGVLMQSGAINTNRITIRGIGARTPYGTNKIRAFYGNIPLTSGDSETTIEDIDPQIINSIEVIKGPLSSVYGAGLGGAIIIEPKYAVTQGSRGAVSSTFGSFGLVKNTIIYSLRTDTGSLNASYHNLQTDGWRDNSKYNREGITLAGDLFRKEKSRLTYFGNYTYMKAYIPSSVDKETFDNSPQSAAYTWAASKGFEQYRSWLGGLAYDWIVTNGLKNSTAVFVNAKDNYEPRPFNILTQNNTAYGARTQFTGNFRAGKRRAGFIAGAEYFADGFTGGTFANLYEDNDNNGSLQGERLTCSAQDRHFINAFMQLRLPMINKFEVQAGVNYNKTTFELNNTFPPQNNLSQRYSYEDIWSPQLSVLYKPGTFKTIYASVSRGFSLPAIEETFTASGTVNPNIKPENGYNFEVGGKFYFLNRSLYTEVNLYTMNINDLLVSQRVGEDQYVGVNAGKTLHQGIEITAKYNKDFGPDFTIQPYVAVSIGHYEFKEFLNNGTDYSGNDLTGVPKNKFNAGIECYFLKGFYASTDFYFVDEIPLNDANLSYADSYSLLNAKAGWKHAFNFGLAINLSAGINNIYNTHYASMVLVNATGFNGASPRYYYPGLPVNYYGGISLNYKL